VRPYGHNSADDVQTFVFLRNLFKIAQNFGDIRRFFGGNGIWINTFFFQKFQFFQPLVSDFFKSAHDIFSIVYLISPPGVKTLTLWPFPLPIRARPIGLWLEILPREISASSWPTKKYSQIFPSTSFFILSSSFSILSSIRFIASNVSLYSAFSDKSPRLLACFNRSAISFLLSVFNDSSSFFNFSKPSLLKYSLLFI